METMTPSLREQGIQALREADLDRAADFLARAVIADGRDAEAQMLLGVVYSQNRLHAEAKRALQSAIDLRPHEARCHFNLGQALEQAGDRSGAVTAYRRALQLNPQYAQAREQLRALGPQVQSLPDSAPGAAASTGVPAGEPPWLRGRSSPAAAPQAGPASALECPRCGQPSRPGLSCEWCSAPLKTAPVRATAPWLQGSYLSASAPAAMGGAGFSSAPEMSAGEAFGRRFAAELIDAILYTIVNQLALWGILGHPAASAGGPLSPGELISTLLPALGISFSLYFAYYCGMLGLCGQTLGKMALGVRVVGPDGGNPSLGRAFLREFVGKTVSDLSLCLGYFWMLWDGEQQTWHDKIAGTHVERA